VNVGDDDGIEDEEISTLLDAVFMGMFCGASAQFKVCQENLRQNLPHYLGSDSQFHRGQAFKLRQIYFYFCVFNDGLFLPDDVLRQ